tara:strand:- start:418 stop:672 length:255 start_codon:yes stop_codon:yes gene_type:complete
MIKDRILEDFAPSEDVLFADGLDEAIIGFEPNLWKVVYSRSLVVDVLMKRDGMGPDEAVEYAEFNIFGAMVGEKTPLWVENYNW